MATADGADHIGVTCSAGQGATLRRVNATPPSLQQELVQSLANVTPNFLSSRAALHHPAPSYSVLLGDFFSRSPPGDEQPRPGPADPYDLALWHPSSPSSVAPRARDGEFERFIMDELASMGCQDPTSYPALSIHLKLDTNRALSCLNAWRRANSINIFGHFYPRPLRDTITFRNHVVILRSNSSYARSDVYGTLSAIARLDTHVPEADRGAIWESNDIAAAVGESILLIEGLINKLDRIIMRSKLQYESTRDESNEAVGLGAAAVVPSDSDGEGGGEDGDESGDGTAAMAERIDSKARPMSPLLVPNDDGVIDLSD